MNPDVMQQLMMLLAGTQQSAPAQPAIQMQSAQPMQAMQANRPMQSAAMIPGRPGDMPGNDVGGPKDPVGNGGNTGGGGKGHRPMTNAQKQENRAALQGPKAYTPAMRKNIGRGVVTPGYGVNPTPAPSGFTQFIDLFTPPNGGI